MKKLVSRFYNCQGIVKDNYFIVKGRNIHWMIFLPLLLWVIFSIPFLFQKEWLNFSYTTYTVLLLGILILITNNFEIQIDKLFVVVKLKFWLVPYYSIKAKTRDLIINDDSITDIKIISPRKDYYKDDVKDNLRFSYIMPFDSNKRFFYIDYNNREINFNAFCDEFVWNSIIAGLRNLDKEAANKGIAIAGMLGFVQSFIMGVVWCRV